MHTVLLRQLISGFASNRMIVAKAIRDIRQQDPDEYVRATVEILRESSSEPGSRFLLSTLLALPDHLAILCDPLRFTIRQATRLIQQVKVFDPRVGVKLARLVWATAREDDSQAGVAARALDLLDQTGEVATALPVLRRLMHCRNAKIRSKAASLIGHETRNPQWADMADCDDPRVQANAVESLWGLASPAAKDAFRRAAHDPYHRVAGNGAVALYLAGDPESIRVTFGFARSEDPRFRAAAVWAMGRMGNPRFLPILGKLVEDSRLHRLAIQAAITIRVKMMHARAAGTVRVQIYGLTRTGAGCTLQILAGDGGPQTRGLDFRDFVVWRGHTLVESFTVEEQAVADEGSKGSQYRICFEPLCDSSRKVRVELYAECGSGSAERFETAANDEMATESDAA